MTLPGLEPGTPQWGPDTVYVICDYFKLDENG
jgi:hypothetical protein